ncbi:MAG: fibrobacter succinogenes major paralogous domain-containing protein [Bacteroidales bacterium]|nr:fibrobacter succinogenes major paralogous domain-containing protein [Bacteroidales bacterium]
MKKILIFLSLFFYLLSPSAQVSVTLRSKYLGNYLFLDSIIVENITQADQIILHAPQDINTYVIDLITGTIVTGVGEINKNGTGIYGSINLPGRFQVAINLLTPENIKISLIDIEGKINNFWEVGCGAGLNTMDLLIGPDKMFICQIKSKSVTKNFKIFGKRGNTTNLIRNIGGKGTELTSKSNSVFHYNPGDGIRFTTIKNGMNSNSVTSTPINNDSILIYLSEPCPNTPTVTDFDGNSYGTVLINNKCWTRENIRSVHYSDGTPLIDGTGHGSIYGDYTTKYWFDYNDDPVLSVIYGKLYTGAAAMNGADGLVEENVQGICPNGWHVARASDWCNMEMFVDSTITNCIYGPHFGFVGANIRNKISETDTIHWAAVFGYPNPATNESGFKALPGGMRNSGGEFHYLNNTGEWWALDGIHGYQQQPRRVITSLYDGITRDWIHTDNALSVRCVKN